jgi:hypothetical protein
LGDTLASGHICCFFQGAPATRVGIAGVVGRISGGAPPAVTLLSGIGAELVKLIIIPFQ